MNEVCQEIWKNFGGKGGPRLDMESHEDLMKRNQKDNYEKDSGYATTKVVSKEP